MIMLNINTIYQYNFADDNINFVTMRCHDIYDIHDIWSDLSGLKKIQNVVLQADTPMVFWWHPYERWLKKMVDD